MNIQQSLKLAQKERNDQRRNRTIEHKLFNESGARARRGARMTTFMKKCAGAVEWGDVRCSALVPAERKQLHKITGGAHLYHRSTNKNFSSLASNPYGRNVFFNEVYSGLKAVWAQPNRKMYFVTLIDRPWCLHRDAKSFDMNQMRDKVQELFEGTGWHGVLFLEVQMVTNLGDYKFLAHLHGFIWRKGRIGSGVQTMRDLLNQNVRGVGKSKGATLSLVDLPNTLPTRYFYATKLPDEGKTYAPVKGYENSFILDRPGKMKVSHPRNYTDRDALRIARLLGQFEVEETVIAIGDGHDLRDKAVAKLVEAVEGVRGLHQNPSPASVVKLISKVLRD